ncbi:MAG: hypothetical protein R3Y53_02760 [Bacillota bacterium]
MPTTDEKKIQESLIQSISLENITGTLMLLQNTLEREEPDSEISHIIELEAYKNYVKNAILNLKDMSECSNETLQNFRMEVDMNIKSLSKMYQTIHTHNIKINHVSTLVRCELVIRALKSGHYVSDIAFSNEEANRLLKEYQAFFARAKDQDNFQEILCEVVKNIPWNLSEDDFYDRMRELLTEMLQTEERHFCDYTINMIRGHIALENPFPAHEECSEVVKFIIDCIPFDPKKLSDRELDVLYDQTLPKMINILFQISTQLEVLYEDMYYLAILYAFSFSFDELLPDPAQKDMYYSTCEFLKKDWNPLDRELQLSAVLAKIEELIDPLVTTLMETLSKNEGYIKAFGGAEKLSEETQRIVVNASVAHAYYLSHATQPYISIDELDSPPYTPEEIEETISSLIKQGKDLFKELSEPIKKLLMQHFRGTIPITYDPESILKEILDLLADPNVSEDDKFLLCENLYPISQDFGYDTASNPSPDPDYDGYFNEDEDFDSLEDDYDY